MSKIFKYTPKVITGPHGTVVHYVQKPYEDEPIEIVLGSIDEDVYISVPNNYEPELQPIEINFQEVELTIEQQNKLRLNNFAKSLKDVTRLDISNNIGDTLDIIAEMQKIQEFLIVALSWLLVDRSKIQEFPQELLQTYGERANIVLDAIKKGTLPLRTDTEDPQKMIMEALCKIANINSIVKDKYIDPLKKIGLK